MLSTLLRLLPLWISCAAAFWFSCLTNMDSRPKCFLKSSNGLWRACALLGDNTLSLPPSLSFSVCVCLSTCLFMFMCVRVHLYALPGSPCWEMAVLGWVAVWKWDKDVWFIGSDRKSICCNVYNPAITTQPNERTIIQSFTPYLPEADSRLEERGASQRPRL